MTSQARTSRVLIALIVSMTLGAIVLVTLDRGGPLGSAWSLANYLKLSPVENSVSNAGVDAARRWNRIEVFYSNTTGGNVRELTLLYGLRTGQDLNAHFVVCNGRGAKSEEIREGQIQYTERWRLQKPCFPDGRWRGSSDTIRICVVADGATTLPTETQVARTVELVNFFRKQFRISSRQVVWPANWPRF